VTRFPAWRVIAWMCAAHVASMSGFSVYATLLPRLQDEWGMNNSEAGFVSGMFFAGYMAAVPLLTSLTDRVDARRVYLVSSFVAAVALAGFALFVEGVKSAALLQLAAGAGIADHIHMHVVPRWTGDTNFMPVLGDVRVMPQHLDDTYAMLRGGFDQ